MENQKMQKPGSAYVGIAVFLWILASILLLLALAQDGPIGLGDAKYIIAFFLGILFFIVGKRKNRNIS